jgi:hypothetical protein
MWFSMQMKHFSLCENYPENGEVVDIQFHFKRFILGRHLMYSGKAVQEL